MAEDYYTTLGVHRKASAEEISRAYRELARKYHPDLNPDDPHAEKKFEQLQAAFEVLHDPARRAAYNRTVQSFATARSSPSHLGDRGDDMKAARRAFAETRRQSRTRPSPLIWQGSVYGPPMIVVTMAWLIVVALGIGLLVAVYLDHRLPVLTDVSGDQEKKERLSHEESEFLTFWGGSLCFGGTLVYGIVMAMLLREHFHQ